MKQIFISEKVEKIFLDSIGMEIPVFLKKKDKLVGMLVNEGGKWIARTGGGYGVDGYHDTREICAKNALGYGYELFIES